MPEITKTDKKLLGILNGFVKSKVLFSAYNLGLFNFLGDHQKTQDEIQAALQLPKRSTKFLLHACQALEILDFQDNVFFIHKDWLPLLTETNVNDPKMHGMHQYMVGHHYQDLYQSMNNLESILKEDNLAEESRIHWLEYAKDNPNERNINAYVPFMDSSVTMIVGALLSSCSFENNRVSLDLFASTGVAACHIAEQNPQLKAYFMDLPKVVEKSVIPEHLKARLHPIGANIYETAFPDDIDLVTIIRSAHDHSDEILLKLFKKAFDKLPKGGLFVIAERMFPEDFNIDSEDLYMRAITFLAMSEDIDYRKASEYEHLLQQAGFSHTEARIPEAPYIYYQGMKIVIATK